MHHRRVDGADASSLFLRGMQRRQSACDVQPDIELRIVDEQHGAECAMRQLTVLQNCPGVERHAGGDRDSAVLNEIALAFAQGGKWQAVHRAIRNDDQVSRCAVLQRRHPTEYFLQKALVRSSERRIKPFDIALRSEGLQCGRPIGNFLCTNRQHSTFRWSVAADDPDVSAVIEHGVLEHVGASGKQLSYTVDAIRLTAGRLIATWYRHILALQHELQQLERARLLRVEKGISVRAVVDEISNQLPIGLLKPREIGRPEDLGLWHTRPAEWDVLLLLAQCGDRVLQVGARRGSIAFEAMEVGTLDQE